MTHVNAGLLLEVDSWGEMRVCAGSTHRADLGTHLRCVGPESPNMTDPTKSDLPIDLHLVDPGGRPARRLFRKRYLLVLLIPLFMFTGAVMGMYFQPPGLQKFYALTGLQPGAGSTSPIALPPDIDLPPKMAATLLPSDVVGLARVMPRGDVSVVAAPYGAGDARVAEVLVAVGDRVEKGAVLARLDNMAALNGAVLMAEANLAVREATLAATRATVQSSRDEAQALLEQTRSAAEEATSQRVRSQDLFDRAVTTQATLDTTRAAERQSLAAVAKAEATLARFTSLALEDQPDVVVAARNADAARADLERARRDVSRAVVRAPISGTVLDITVTPGARPPSDGIMQIGDTSAMMAEVEIWQDRILQVAVGQPVELAAPALGITFQGRVQSIGLTVGRQGLLSDDSAANTDARVVRVMVALDAASSLLAAGFTNLEVVARIDTQAAQ